MVSAVIPALNEENSVGAVVTALLRGGRVAEVVVVDHNSSDCTAAAAKDAGAVVVTERGPGLGRAIKAGIRAASSNEILKTDADIIGWNVEWSTDLADVRRKTLTRGTFVSPYDSFPVTRLVVKPNLTLFCPELLERRTPITGTYSFDRRDVDLDELMDNWAFDISLLVHAHEQGYGIRDLFLGELEDRPRDIEHYEPMALDILSFFVAKFAPSWCGRN